MKLIDHHESEMCIDVLQMAVVIDELALQRFRGNQEHASRRFLEALFIRRANVAVPAVDGNFCISAEVFEPPKLVIDERLQWADVERLNGAGWFSSELRKYG
jgi:hypothetical protein